MGLAVTTPCKMLWLVSGVWRGHRSWEISELYSVQVPAGKEENSGSASPTPNKRTARQAPFTSPPPLSQTPESQPPTLPISFTHPGSFPSQSAWSRPTQLKFCLSPAQSFFAYSHCLPPCLSHPPNLPDSSTSQLSLRFSLGPRSSVGTVPSDLHPSCSPPQPSSNRYLE